MNLTIRRLLSTQKLVSKRMFKFQNCKFMGKFNNSQDFVDKNETKTEEFYEIEDKLSFVNGKYLLSQSKSTDIKGFRMFQLLVVTPVNIYLGYKTIKSVIFLRPIRSIFWGILFLLASRLNYGIHSNLFHFVDKIYLLEDGMKSEFTFYNAKQTIVTENINIRKVNQKEVMFILTLAPNIFDKFVPIIINHKVYFLAKENEIANKPVFSAVMSGNYIRIKSDKDNEKIIDIK